MLITSAIVAGGVAGLASLPHCAAMCGPVAAFAGRDGRTTGLYLSGRFASYATTGALAGGFGGLAVGWLEAPLAQALLSWVLGLGLALTAWRLWRPTRGGLVQLRTKPSAPAGGRASLRATGLGLLTGVLPCGALAAALLLAAGSGDAASGALTMLAFALASAPALFGAGTLAAWLRRSGLTTRRVLAVALALGAVVLMLRPIDALRGEPTQCHGAQQGSRS
ncbi:MAG: sulfite exporter TauE/SafE family protein [Myxococcales bacterium]|nr:sulfite exporter TauE/SafE family protein [Myxococcales bacterium]